MKNFIAWTVIVILIVIGFLFWSKNEMPKPAGPNGATSVIVPNIVHYFCRAGNIDANYSNNQVVLTLSPLGQIFTLGQTMSGSGIRYESGAGTSKDIVFASEGDNATLTIGTSTDYTNCISGNRTSTGSAEASYSNAQNTFSFTYPTMFTLSGGGPGYTQDWKVNATTTGMILAELDVPQSYMPKTNFVDAKFTVGVSSDPSAVALCATPVNGEKSLGVVKINGVPFTKITGSDAGAGNLYDTTSYENLHGNECYVVEYTIHYAELGNFSPDQGITQFDEAKLQGLLDGVAQSFKFI